MPRICRGRCHFQKRRLLLPLPVILVLTFWFATNNHAIYLLTPVVAISAFIILFNVPEIATLLHQRPLYYQDLAIAHELDDIPKKRFQRIFQITLNVVLSLAVAAILNYQYYSARNSALSLFEIVCMLGGFFSLCGKCQTWVGNSLLQILHWQKQRDEKMRKAEQQRSHLRGQHHSHYDQHPNDDASVDDALHHHPNIQMTPLPHRATVRDEVCAALPPPVVSTATTLPESKFDV